MIRGFKIYAEGKKVGCVLLEYGNSDKVTVEEITKSLEELEVKDFDLNELQEAIDSGMQVSLDLAEEAPDNIPGICWLAKEPDGTVKACVKAPRGSGRTVSLTDIEKELVKAGHGEMFRMDDIIRRNMENHAKDSKSISFKAAEARDGEITVEVTADKRTAYVTYSRPRGGEPLTKDDMLAKLSSASVVFGVDQNVIDELLTKNEDASKSRIAGALEPVDGEDASIKYLFDAYHLNTGPRISESDVADFRDLGIFENVEEATPLVRKEPATEGEDGMDVTGKALKAKPGRDTPLPKGKNTRICATDENILESATAGAPRLAAGKVVVEDVLIVGDVDFTTGNINFVGNVMIKGIVNTGFTIEAEGDITCMDVVEGAVLKAGGNILFKRGIKGQGKSIVEAGGDVIAKFIEHCKVISHGSIIVDEALIHSDSSAADRIEVIGKKGQIFGGTVTAGKLVRANYIGSEMAIRTEIEVGAAPHLRNRLEELHGMEIKKKSDYSKASKNLLALNVMRDKGDLPEEREELIQTLKSVTQQLRGELEDIKYEIEKLDGDLKESAAGTVEAGKLIYAGVRIAIKSARRWIKEPMQQTIFLKEGPDIVLSGELAETSTGKK